MPLLLPLVIWVLFYNFFFLTSKRSTSVQGKSSWSSTRVPLRVILSSQVFLCCALQYHVSSSEISVSNLFSCHLLWWCYSVNYSICCPLHLKLSIFSWKSTLLLLSNFWIRVCSASESLFSLLENTHRDKHFIFSLRKGKHAANEMLCCYFSDMVCTMWNVTGMIFVLVACWFVLKHMCIFNTLSAIVKNPQN